MIVLLGEPEDDDLLWLAASLQRRSEHVEVVLPEELTIDSTLTCRVDCLGVSSSLRLRDGRLLDSHTVELVVNRLADLRPVSPVRSAADASYLAEEWRAALVAWLRMMPRPVLNPPRAAALGGPVMSPAAWRSIASAHGFSCRSWTSQEQTTPIDPVELVCVGSSWIDPTSTAPRSFGTPLCEMAKSSGAPLLGARFDRGDEWVFIDANGSPHLQAAGQPLVDAIVQYARKGGVPA